jgi:hypothetical protein
MYKIVFFSTTIGFLGAACLPADETGCPLEPADAVGEYCPDNGQQCGEFSLCDPCTSDLSDCEMLECREFAWVAVTPDDVCETDGGS